MAARSARRRTAGAVASGPAQLAFGASVLAVRVWPARDYTRLTIESDAALKTSQTFIADPPRLAVDIEGWTCCRACASWCARCRQTIPTSPACGWDRTRPTWCGW